MHKQKEEVLLSRRDGAEEMHKQKRKYFSAGGMGSRNFSFGNYTGKQELGDIRVHLVVRTSGADLGPEHTVVVLGMVRRWPAFHPFSSRGERPNSEIKTIELS